ncbi:MAG: alanine racemase [bacterium]
MAKYQVLNEITISSNTLEHNFEYFASLNPQAQIAPVLKANAYGHDLKLVANYVDSKLKVPFLCVDSLYEAYELHKARVTTPIFIMGYTDPANYGVWKKLPFIFSVWDQKTLLALNKHQPGARIHLKLDTGMSRLGLQMTEIQNFLKTLSKCNNLRIEGVYSHLSQADDPSRITFTRRQIALFKEMVSHFEKAGFNFKYKHIASTAGATTIRDSYFNLIRLGLGFYGYSPFGPHTKEGRGLRENLKPTLTLTSRIAHLKTLSPGDQVGYGGIYQAKQKELIAILPLGYSDGISRSLSNRTSFVIRGTACPVVGNISMNMTTIKIPRTINARVGDQVTVISSNVKSPCSVYQLASLLNTIPYTILTNLHSSTRRTLI